jgi:hypothetical protein
LNLNITVRVKVSMWWDITLNQVMNYKFSTKLT